MNIVVDLPIPAYEPGLAALKARGDCTVTCVTPLAVGPRELDPALASKAEILFCGWPPPNVAQMQALRWVQVYSTGYSQLFGLGLTERGIRATNSRGCFDVPISEWNIAMMVNLLRNVRQMIRNQDAAIWDRAAEFQRELRGATVGLWGYGGIGRETARLCHQMGLKVHVLTRSGIKPRPHTYSVPGTGDPEGVLPDRVFVSGEELSFLGGLDFLVLSMPLTKATEGLVGERELRALPKTCYLLNPARGPIVREEALIRALQEGWIAGAALDTHYKYPLPADHPLWKMPNVILTPHISGSNLTPRFSEMLWDLFCQNVERYASGQPLLNKLTASQLAGD